MKLLTRLCRSIGMDAVIYFSRFPFGRPAQLILLFFFEALKFTN